MHGAVETLILAFTIGLTGALAPGPTLVATINSSLQRGWTMGPKVAAGHAITEVVVFLLIVVGLAAAAEEHTAIVALIGGSALILFGLLTLKGSKTATMKVSSNDASSNPYLAGALTSVANPYFWVWWLSIGSALVLAELREGLILAMIFMIGHWGADFGWYTLISTSLDRGRTLLSEANYRRTLALCGAFLILFGARYLADAWAV
ncbi:MAG TPA: LysE family transporter [Methanothrix sp.]|nr:LysE family transporter [Methanothrix sp.]